jgi:hypothetical protein
MARLTLKYRILFLFAAIPGVYRGAIWFRRTALRRARSIVGNVARAIFPESSIRFGPPKRAISLLPLLKANDPNVEGKIVLERQEITPMPPDSLSHICGQQTWMYQPFPIIWTHHKNARLVGRTLGLVLPPKTFVLESTYGNHGLWTDPAYNYVYLPPPVELRGNYTSVLSFWVRNNVVPNFSHWLLDALPRLAALDCFPEDTKVLVPGRLAEYQKESLRLLGLEDRIRYTPESHLLVESYYLSSPASMIACESAYTLSFLRQRLLPKASPTFKGPKRFIIDRQGVTRGIQNGEEFNQFFRDLGWAIIDTATLSFADEIKLFMDAEAFCGAIGSGFTNAVWSRPGCAVIQLVSETVMDGSTEWICTRNQLRWRFMICPHDARQRIYVDLKQVRKILEDLSLI